MSFAFRCRSACLFELGFEELLLRPDSRRAQGRVHRLEQRRVAVQDPRFEQRRHDAHIGRALLHALGNRAHAVSHLEADIPQERNEPLHLGALGVVRRLRHQQQDVDVRAGVQFAATVTADGHQRPVPVAVAQMLEPGLAQHRIDEGGARVHQRLDRFFAEKAGFEFLVGLLQLLAVFLPRARMRGQLRRQARQQRPDGGVHRLGQQFLE